MAREAALHTVAAAVDGAAAGSLSKDAERGGAYRVAKRLQTVVLNAEGRTSGELVAVRKAPRFTKWHTR
jgi:hypothetical protein